MLNLMRVKQEMPETKELREMSLAELQKKLEELRGELFQYRMKWANGQLKNHHLIRTTKRDIARVKTVINEKKRQNKELDKTSSHE
ncbi:hypothetical protein HS7_09510 [Sulfolobales archaeon HS-7]|nr:hypothetical protein HS7_09510 [Sulfolobales archaeon HS-7]